MNLALISSPSVSKGVSCGQLLSFHTYILREPLPPPAPQEQAIEREREEAKRYRLRLVPRASSVTCRSMVISLPAFLVAAARGAKR